MASSSAEPRPIEETRAERRLAAATSRVARIAPGLPALLHYRLAPDFPHDLIFGTSRQLMVNPDAATCAMIAAAVAPHAGGDPEVYLSFSIALTFFAGVICVIASFFRLGAMADFLSRPILVGFLNGIAISIFLGQAGKLLGFRIEAGGIVPRVIEILAKLPHAQLPACAIGAASLAGMWACLRFLP